VRDYDEGFLAGFVVCLILCVTTAAVAVTVLLF
jgi:tetrahydromethanopterin S-methyltransferase subunit G